MTAVAALQPHYAWAISELHPLYDWTAGEHATGVHGDRADAEHAILGALVAAGPGATGCIRAVLLPGPDVDGYHVLCTVVTARALEHGLVEWLPADGSP